jgi:hypothetical protein
MSEQVAPSAVTKRIILTFLTKENVKPADILMRLRAELIDEAVSRIQVYDWRKSFKESRKQVENMQRLQILQEKFWRAFLGLLQGVLFIDSLIEQRITNAAYYSKLLKTE